MFSSVLVIISALAVPRFALASDPVQCFYPDGSKAEGDLPCFRNDSLSRVCCAPNQVCSTNKLCVNKPATSPAQTFRGSCLDPAFGLSCPNFCTGSNRNGQAAVVTCGDPKAGTFCCDDGTGTGCCAIPSKLLSLGVGNTFPEGVGASSVLSMSTMMNPPAAANTPQALISMQSNSAISFSPPTISTTSSSGQPAAMSLDSTSTSSSPPPTFLPGAPAREEGQRRPTASATPTDSKISAEPAIIVGAENRTPAVASSPPLSAITIASAAIGGVVIVTLIIVVSVIVMRWRTAKKEEERQIEESAVGTEYNGGIRKSVREAGSGDGGSSGDTAGSETQPTSAMAEIGRPNGFGGPDRTRQATSPTPDSETGVITLQREVEPRQWPSQQRDVERTVGMTQTRPPPPENPFNRPISLSPFDSPFDDNRDGDILDSPTKGYLNERGSDWSNATLTTNHEDVARGNERSRSMRALDREAEQLRARYPDAAVQESEWDGSNDRRLRDPPMVETSYGMRVPAAGLERGVRRNSNGSLDSETFQKLLYDVQSQPF